jgi:hypothetical protein
MRHLPNTTRIAIATLVLRYRDERRRHRQLSETHGEGSLAAMMSDARRNELWNSIQSLRTNVHSEMDGRRPSIGDAGEFMKYVVMRSRTLKSSAGRQHRAA